MYGVMRVNLQTITEIVPGCSQIDVLNLIEEVSVTSRFEDAANRSCLERILTFRSNSRLKITIPSGPNAELTLLVRRISKSYPRVGYVFLRAICSGYLNLRVGEDLRRRDKCSAFVPTPVWLTKIFGGILPPSWIDFVGLCDI